MRTAVKAIATAGMFAIVTVQPSADAARAPYSTERLAQQLSSPMFNPYADAMAGVFVPREDMAAEAPNSVIIKPSVAMMSPEPVQTPKLPEYPLIERFDPEVPAVVVPPPAEAEAAKSEAQSSIQPSPPVIEAETPPAVSIPLPSPREAVVPPPAPAPKLQPREEPIRRAARPAPRTSFIALDRAAAAPFAHTRFCLKYPAECRVTKQTIKFRGGPIELTAARRSELTRINLAVNRSIVATVMNEPVAQEQWVISPKFGDCNDYAVTKRH